MEQNKDYRKGNKTRLKLSAARKNRIKNLQKKSNRNKENDFPVPALSESCASGLEINTNVTNYQPQTNTISPLTPVSPNRLPLPDSSNKIIVQAVVHEAPQPENHVRSQQISSRIIENVVCDWDAIEIDNESARNTSDLATLVAQEEIVSSFNKSTDTDSDYDLPVETANIENKSTLLEGNRIVNIPYFFEQIKNITHDPFECSFRHFDFLKEKRSGFYSEYYFKCNLCNKIEKFKSQKSGEDNAINLNIIEGITQTGNGWSQLDEVCASVNLPNMSESYYIKNYNKLATIQKDIALQLMLEAGAEERRLALENNDVSSEGVPCITVVTDGSWAKRSYGTNYNSFSGLGCIIGYRTKKILYIGIKNSYCCICALDKSKKKPIRTHKCFKKFSGPSTEMETSAIVDGFKVSMAMHGVMYTKLIGDGDSSVTNALRDAMVYGPTVHIRKIECSNHLMRNYTNKLRKIAKKTENKVGFVPVTLRQALSNRIKRLHNAVTGAVAHARALEISTEDKLRVLNEDLRNGPCHVFGWHDCCKDYYCKKISEENLVPQLKASGLWAEMYENLGWLLQNTESLLLKETNNPAEQFNSIIAKFLAGKRVNFCLRGTYEARCFSAVSSYNLKDYTFLNKIQKVISPDATNTYAEKYILKKQKIIKNKRKRSAAAKACGAKRAKRFKIADKNYGNIVEEPDMSLDIFEKKKKEFLLSLNITPEEIKLLEKKTVAQANSDLWIIERKKRITASLFGQICKMKDSTPCTSVLKIMLYSTFTGNDATRYGKAHEKTALAELENTIYKKVTECGLFIDCDKPYLGASPDGIVGTDSIVEIKCPASASAYTPLEAIRLKKITFCIETGDGVKLKNSHNYYYQVQGQLKITKRKYCYFVIWTPKGIAVDIIENDPAFWTEQKMFKLEQFYFKCVLPELIDPRFPRKLPFRDRF